MVEQQGFHGVFVLVLYEWFGALVCRLITQCLPKTSPRRGRNDRGEPPGPSSKQQSGAPWIAVSTSEHNRGLLDARDKARGCGERHEMARHMAKAKDLCKSLV